MMWVDFIPHEKKSMNLNDEQMNELFSEINKWRK